MKISALMMVILLSVGCGNDAKKSTTNPNNVSNNTTNNSTNNSTNNGTNTIDLSDFDQTCDFDSSCVLVNVEPCGCSCASDAINTSDEAAFNAAVNAITCDDRPLCDVFCEEVLPACWESKCYARTPIIVSADDYDNSCETVDDCMYIATGDICSDCQCAATPVNRADYEANPPGPAECTPGPQVCDCAAPPAIACNEGVCGFAD